MANFVSIPAAGPLALTVTSLCVALAAGAANGEHAEAARPNVVVFLADDLGYGDLGCFGHPHIATPNLDRLADQGARLTSFYASAPVCSPTRASLLTGRAPPRHGLVNVIETTDADMRLAADEVLLAESLSRSGYVTGIVGKWHIGEAPPFRPTRRGFDFFFGGLLGSLDFFRHDFVGGQHDLWRGDFHESRDGQYITDLEADQAVAFIAEHADEPFFLYVPWHAVHTSLGSTTKGQLQAPKAWLARYANIADERARTYAACVSALDEGVGRVLDSLEAAGAAENTLVIFTSDNGPEPNWTGTAAPYHSTKHTLWEGGIRVPCVARWPVHIAPGVVIDTPAVTHDLFPTILAATGAPRDERVTLDGENLLPVLLDVSGPEADRLAERTLCWSYIRDTLRVSREQAARRGRWKWLNGELYDLKTDPGETRDLSADKPEVAAELAAAWRAWVDQFPNEAARWRGRQPLRHKSDQRRASPSAAAEVK